MHLSVSNDRLVGVALIVLGVLFLLPLRFSIGDWWPLILVFVGLGSISRSSITGGLIVTAVGVVFLLNNLNMWDISLGMLWPAALVAIGVSILFGSARARVAGGTGDAPPAGNDLYISSLFSGANRRIDSQNFTGGSISTTFGGAEVDLRGSAIAGDAATINVNATFGGVKLQVPHDWAVDVRVAATFGGVETKRPEPADPKATLTVTGSCLFGGIEITS